jgi:hypothetical protein
MSASVGGSTTTGRPLSCTDWYVVASAPYLDHIDLEERAVMQRLPDLIGIEEIAAMHGAEVAR